MGPPKKAPKNVLPRYNHLIPNQTNDNYKPASYNISGMCNYEDSLRPIHSIPMPPVVPPRIEIDINSQEIIRLKERDDKIAEMIESYRGYNPEMFSEENLRKTESYKDAMKKLNKKEK